MSAGLSPASFSPAQDRTKETELATHSHKTETYLDTGMHWLHILKKTGVRLGTGRRSHILKKTETYLGTGW